ncbi:MAG: hypothetical protein H0T65_22230, partial [Deltaproteobacteria bacterium]|nr:hypothetical protein [Deltaproteobacteria bacterium]
MTQSLLILFGTLVCFAPPALGKMHNTQRLLYAAVDGAVEVYDIDAKHRHVRTIPVPDTRRVRGIAAHAGTKRLYVAHYGGQGEGTQGTGELLALDLVSGKLAWKLQLVPSVDRMAVTPDGRFLYMPAGEDVNATHWFVIDAAAGKEIGRIQFATRSHNTIASLDGKHVYLSSRRSPYLAVVDVATHKIVKEVGPFTHNIRPFVVNGRNTLAYVNVDGLNGFEVGSIVSGRKLMRVEVSGFPIHDPNMGNSHGVALSPDETQVWVADWVYNYVHVFDVTALPPRQLVSIPVTPTRTSGPLWVNFNLDGRFVYSSTGEVFDAKTRKVAARIVESRFVLEVQLAKGVP